MTKHVTKKNQTPFYFRVRFNGLRDKFYYFKDIGSLLIGKRHVDTMLHFYLQCNPGNKDSLITSSYYGMGDCAKIEYTIDIPEGVSEQSEQYQALYLFLLAHIRFTQKIFESNDNRIIRLYLNKVDNETYRQTAYRPALRKNTILLYLPKKGDFDTLVEFIENYAKRLLGISLSDISITPNGQTKMDWLMKDLAGIYNVETSKEIRFINFLFQQIYPTFKRGKRLPLITSNHDIINQRD